jgi:hypothetical protein
MKMARHSTESLENDSMPLEAREVAMYMRRMLERELLGEGQHSC